jgi:hypothetical protein
MVRLYHDVRFRGEQFGSQQIRRLLFAALTIIASFAATNSWGNEPPKIIGLTDISGKASFPKIGLNEDLVIKLSGKEQIDPARYVLFLNGREISGLDDTTYRSEWHALVFHLRRNSNNAAAWAALLGSPDSSDRKVSVALGEKKSPPATTQPTITGEPETTRFSLVLLSPWRLTFAFVAVAIILALVWGGAKRTAILKDNLLPQVPQEKQTYSLGRWQMAYWFTLIFASFLFLFVLLWDYNTVTEQALMLMGIAGATGLAAVAVDVMKDGTTPIATANKKLRDLGLNSHADVVRVQREIEDRAKALESASDDATKKQLEKDIKDRRELLNTYGEAIKPFVSGGWFRDLTTDSNGPTLHRLQVLCWTWILGIVFVIGVYRDLAMPQFSGTLLALMAVAGGTYVGFKYPEKQQ